MEYANLVKNLKLDEDTYYWAKDFFGVYHRSKVGILDDAIESYADGVPAFKFRQHMADDIDRLCKMTTMRELLEYVSEVAEQEGFF